jgi:hypothetical protein
MSVVNVGNPYQAHYDAMANTMQQAHESLPRAPLAPAPAYRAPAPGSAEEASQRASWRAMYQPMHAEHPTYLDMKAEHDEYAADPAAWHAKHVARINKEWAPYRNY